MFEDDSKYFVHFWHKDGWDYEEKYYNSHTHFPLSDRDDYCLVKNLPTQTQRAAAYIDKYNTPPCLCSYTAFDRFSADSFILNNTNHYES